MEKNFFYVENVYQDFLIFKESQLNKNEIKKSTYGNVKNSINRIKRFADLRNKSNALKNFNDFVKLANEYLSEDNAETKASTKYTDKNIIANFLGWCFKNKITKNALNEELLKVKKPASSRAAFSFEELKTLFIDGKLAEYSKFKNSSVVETLSYVYLLTGMRLSEIKQIDFDEFIANDFKTEIQALKNGNKRVVFINEKFKLWIDELDIEHAKNLIIENKNKIMERSTCWIRKMFREFFYWLNENGVEIKQFSAHIFRHTFYTRFAGREGKGGGLENAMLITGAKNAEIVKQTYLHLKADDLILLVSNDEERKQLDSYIDEKVNKELEKLAKEIDELKRVNRETTEKLNLILSILSKSETAK